MSMRTEQYSPFIPAYFFGNTPSGFEWESGNRESCAASFNPETEDKL